MGSIESRLPQRQCTRCFITFEPKTTGTRSETAGSGTEKLQKLGDSLGGEGYPLEAMTGVQIPVGALLPDAVPRFWAVAGTEFACCHRALTFTGPTYRHAVLRFGAIVEHPDSPDTAERNLGRSGRCAAGRHPAAAAQTSLHASIALLWKRSVTRRIARPCSVCTLAPEFARRIVKQRFSISAVQIPLSTPAGGLDERP